MGDDVVVEDHEMAIAAALLLGDHATAAATAADLAEYVADRDGVALRVTEHDGGLLPECRRADGALCWVLGVCSTRDCAERQFVDHLRRDHAPGATGEDHHGA